MNSAERRFFKIAKEVSKFSTFNGPSLGCVVVEGKTVISTGYNSDKTNPVQDRYNFLRYDKVDKYYPPLAHAEVSALSRLMGRPEINWKNITVYIYREAAHKPACSRPCKSCLRLIKDLGIKSIYFIDEYGNFCKEKIIGKF